MPQDRRRAWARAVLVFATLAALLVVLAPAAMAQGQPTDPGQERCDTIPNPVARNVCKAGTNPGQAVTGAAVIGTAGNRATSSFAAMSSADEGGGGESAAPAAIRSSARPAAANLGGNGGVLVGPSP